jgi:hypothetical protein
MPKKFTETELANPATVPNPWIGQLLTIRNHVSNESFDLVQTDPELAFEYSKASDHILQAITDLYAAKNIMSRDQETPLSSNIAHS